jgi:hypothetical protein
MTRHLLWVFPTLLFISDEFTSLSLMKDDGMDPLIKKGDVVLVNRLARHERMHSNSVVLMRNPEASRGATDMRLIRRVQRWDGRSFKGLKDCKESEARDSKEFGSVSDGLVLGKVLAIVFPPWRAGKV